MTEKKVISFGLKKFIERHKSVYGSVPPKGTLDKIKKQFQDGASSLDDNRLLYGLADDGSVEFVALSNVVFIGGYDRKFLIFPMSHCSSEAGARRRFYGAIRTRAAELSSRKDIKELAVWCNTDDPLSRKYFAGKGELNHIQLVGDVKTALSFLKNGSPHKTRKLRMGDVRAVSKIEQLAHMHESSSRMHKAARQKNASRKFLAFAKMLVKKSNAFVSLDGKKVTGFGAVFPNKKNNVAIVATIAVHPDYGGQGISKSLMRELLGSLQKAGIQKCVGHSSTTAVLGMSQKMNCVEFSRAYSIPLKRFVAG